MFDNLKWETKALVMLLTMCIGGISAVEDLSENLGVKSNGERVSKVFKLDSSKGVIKSGQVTFDSGWKWKGGGASFSGTAAFGEHGETAHKSMFRGTFMPKSSGTGGGAAGDNLWKATLTGSVAQKCKHEIKSIGHQITSDQAKWAASINGQTCGHSGNGWHTFVKVSITTVKSGKTVCEDLPIIECYDGKSSVDGKSWSSNPIILYRIRDFYKNYDSEWSTLSFIYTVHCNIESIDCEKRCGNPVFIWGRK